MADNSVIQLESATVIYDDMLVLDQINFTLHAGEFCYLIGKTGAGKSSFLKLLYRDIIPDEGSVHVAGYDVASLPEREVPYLRRRLGVIFQDFQLLPDRSIYDNVAFALEVTDQKKRHIKKRVLEVLTMVGLSHRRKSMPSDLSGGELQRVVIARALANEPRILLADEPTGNLDPEASWSIMELLREINKQGMAVLMVTHDYETVRRFPDRTVQLRDGRLEEVKII